MHFLAISDEGTDTVESFRDAYGLELRMFAEGGSVHTQYQQELAFPTGAYPQEWIVGTDGRIAYVNNTFEVDAVVEVLDAQLGR